MVDMFRLSLEIRGAQEIYIIATACKYRKAGLIDTIPRDMCQTTSKTLLERRGYRILTLRLHNTSNALRTYDDFRESPFTITSSK